MRAGHGMFVLGLATNNMFGCACLCTKGGLGSAAAMNP